VSTQSARRDRCARQRARGLGGLRQARRSPRRRGPARPSRRTGRTARSRSGDGSTARTRPEPSSRSGRTARARKQVTHPESGVEDGGPDWSPDGSLIAFQRSGNPYAVYTVKPDGSDLQRLTQPDEDGSGMSFLPDGKRIVYTRASGSEKVFPGGERWIEHSDLVVRDVNGSNLSVLIQSGHWEATTTRRTSHPTARGSSTSARTHRSRSPRWLARSSSRAPTAPSDVESRRGRSMPETIPTGRRMES